MRRWLQQNLPLEPRPSDESQIREYDASWIRRQHEGGQGEQPCDGPPRALPARSHRGSLTTSLPAFFMKSAISHD